MGIFELNKTTATFYGNLDPINPPFPFYLNIAENDNNNNNIENIIYNAASYILDPNKTTMYDGNVLIRDDNSLNDNTYKFITTQFMTRKIFSEKLSPYPIKHLTITFTPDYHISAHEAQNIAEYIIYFLSLFDSHQYLYAVHNIQWNYKEGRLSHPHIHFLINTTDRYTGKTLDLNSKMLTLFQSAILQAIDTVGILNRFNVPITQISRLYEIPLLCDID